MQSSGDEQKEIFAFCGFRLSMKSNNKCSHCALARSWIEDDRRSCD